MAAPWEGKRMAILTKKDIDGMKKDYENGAFYKGYPLDDLFETIEAQQKEIDNWKYETQCHMDEVVARDKTIQAMREALEQARSVLVNTDYYSIDIDKSIEAIDKALSISDSTKINNSTQKDNEPSKLYPRENETVKKENRQVNEGDKLATLKETPKKVIRKGYLTGNHFLCGSCKALINKDSYLPFDYCPCCGQKLDWNE